ncbi:hypothetical protein ZWY2020_020272 [Hordeum vulgare]|nr:hypothetical protein ZWY2020_020272 [Hordeum vulgare]
MGDEEKAILAVSEPDESTRNKFICFVGLSFLASFATTVLLVLFYGGFSTIVPARSPSSRSSWALCSCWYQPHFSSFMRIFCVERNCNPDGERLVDKFIRFDVFFWDCIGWHDIFDGTLLLQYTPKYKNGPD